MARTQGSKNKITKHPLAHTTVSVDTISWRIFKDYAESRGFTASKALRMAMGDFIGGGCDRLIKKFKAQPPLNDMAKALQGMMKGDYK